MLLKQLNQKHQYDKNARDLKALKDDDTVYVMREPNKPFVPARIVKSCDRPRSYEIELENKKRIERNRRHIFGPVIKDELPDKPKHDSETNCKGSQKNTKLIRNLTNNNKNNCNTFRHENTAIVTRSGRESKLPKYLNHYKM